MIFEGEVQTPVNLITTLPFNFDNSIIVANSISRVENGKTNILLANVDDYDIIIKKGQQIAGCEPVIKADGLLEECLNSEEDDFSSVIDIDITLNESQVEGLMKVIYTNKQAFSFKNKIGFTKTAEHRIELINNTEKPFIGKLRRHPQAHIEEAEKQVRSMLNEGIVEESNSPYCSEFVLVKKKDGSYRMCIDFRWLNKITKKDAYTLPDIEDCLYQIAGNRYFSQIDFASGYWQVPMETGSKQYMAFRVNNELYQFVRLPFGLTNAPSTF